MRCKLTSRRMSLRCEGERHVHTPASANPNTERVQGVRPQMVARREAANRKRKRGRKEQDKRRRLTAPASECLHRVFLGTRPIGRVPAVSNPMCLQRDIACWLCLSAPVLDRALA
jgi:hypothetical protein